MDFVFFYLGLRASVFAFLLRQEYTVHIPQIHLGVRYDRSSKLRRSFLYSKDVIFISLIMNSGIPIFGVFTGGCGSLPVQA